jgi:hypothetical protein
MLSALLGSILAVSTLPGGSNAFEIARDYSGANFFQGWDFFGSWDNLTLGMSHEMLVRSTDTYQQTTGNVWWLNETAATEERLAYVNNAGNAIIKVDNITNVPPNNVNLTRNSVCVHPCRLVFPHSS